MKSKQSKIFRSNISIFFAEHGMDIGMNTKFTVELTPKDAKAVYRLNQSLPIYLKENVTVELDLVHTYGIITALLFSKYASPILAWRNTNWKQRLLVDLRKINSLIADHYTNDNHPVSTLPDADNFWLRSLSYASLIAPRPIIPCRWLTNG